jgi:hypothetical protein
VRNLFRGLLVIGLSFNIASLLAQDTPATPFPEIEFDETQLAEIKLEDYPVLPEVTEHAHLIYERGLASGQNQQSFVKVGDCMTAAEFFLFPFGTDSYDLGEFDTLQPVIDYYLAGTTRSEGDAVNPFATDSLAAESGFNTASILDPIWSDPTWCTQDESPLACEYRLARPAFAFIMVGTNDVQFFEAGSFNEYLRTIVQETITQNIVPVLYTFPERPEFPEKTLLFNQIIIQVALDYDLPLINLNLALQDLPDKGVDITDPIHLSLPEDEAVGDFTEENLKAGYTLRNLITLEALQKLDDGLRDEPNS